MVNKFAFKSARKTVEITETDEEEENSNSVINQDSQPALPTESAGEDFDMMDFLQSNDEAKDPISVGIDLLLSPNNIMMKTDVPAQAIPVLSRAIALAKKYRSESLLEYLDNYLKLRVSKDREGRKEILAMILRSNNRADDDFGDF